MVSSRGLPCCRACCFVLKMYLSFFILESHLRVALSPGDLVTRTYLLYRVNVVESTRVITSSPIIDKFPFDALANSVSEGKDMDVIVITGAEMYR